MKPIRLLVLLSVLALGANAQQQTTEPRKFSLREAVDFAKQNNYTLKNNQLEVTRAEKQVNEVLASGLPQINATGSYLHNIQIPTQVLPNFLKPTLVAANPGTADQIPDIISAQFGQKFSATGSITASQLLFDGSFLMGVKASREFVNLSRINKNRGEIETEVTVSKAYYSALLVQTNLALIDTNLSTLTKTRNEAEKIYQNGLMEKTDFDRLTLQQSTLKLQRERVLDMQRISLMVLKLQMGMNVNDSIVLTDNLEKLYTTSTLPAVENKVTYSKRPEYQLLQQQQRLNTLNKKRYSFGYAPSLNIFITHQQNTFGQTFGDMGKAWYPGTFYGLNLNIPIFDGFRKSAQSQQVRVDMKQTENNMKLMQSAIDQEVAVAKLSYERAGQQLKIQEDNMKLAQEIYNRTELKYKNGVGSSLEMNVAQNDLELARQNYLSNIYDYFSAQLDLRKAMGDIK